jgi:hypothetical protein
LPSLLHFSYSTSFSLDSLGPNVYHSCCVNSVYKEINYWIACSQVLTTHKPVENKNVQ